MDPIMQVVQTVKDMDGARWWSLVQLFADDTSAYPVLHPSISLVYVCRSLYEAVGLRQHFKEEQWLASIVALLLKMTFGSMLVYAAFGKPMITPFLNESVLWINLCAWFIVNALPANAGFLVFSFPSIRILLSVAYATCAGRNIAKYFFFALRMFPESVAVPFLAPLIYSVGGGTVVYFSARLRDPHRKYIFLEPTMVVLFTIWATLCMLITGPGYVPMPLLVLRSFFYTITGLQTHEKPRFVQGKKKSNNVKPSEKTQ